MQTSLVIPPQSGNLLPSWCPSWLRFSGRQVQESAADREHRKQSLKNLSDWRDAGDVILAAAAQERYRERQRALAWRLERFRVAHLLRTERNGPWDRQVQGFILCREAPGDSGHHGLYSPLVALDACRHRAWRIVARLHLSNGASNWRDLATPGTQRPQPIRHGRVFGSCPNTFVPSSISCRLPDCTSWS